MVVGARVDPLFGPLVVVGLGGILVELLQDTALAPAPVTHDEALALLRSSRARGCWMGSAACRRWIATGWPSDLHVSRRSPRDHRDAIAELDVNPLICAGDRITAVDALIVPRP